MNITPAKISLTFMFKLLLGIGSICLLYIISINQYLLFHSLIEFFSISIAFTMFFLAWNSREFNKSGYIEFLGLAFLFIGSLDLIHTLAYKGMNIFIRYDADLPTQLWIAARYLQSITFMAAALLMDKHLKPKKIISVYAVITFILFFLVFYRYFPSCYIEGKGLTIFKKISEYIISLILLYSLLLLYRKRKQFNRKVISLLYVSIISTIISEISFTFYIGVYGISNFIGHIFKLIAFYLIYKAVIEAGLKKPYSTLFGEVVRNEARYRLAQEIGQVGNWEYSITTTEFWGSDEAKRIYGFEPESDKFTTEKVESCIPDRIRVHQALVDLIEHDKPYDLEFEIITYDNNETRIIHSTAILEKDENNNPVQVTGVIRDVTEKVRDKKEIETKTKELEKHLNISEKQRIANLVILKDLNKLTAKLKSEIKERMQAEDLLTKRMTELEVFNEAAVDREIKINMHRKEINELLAKLGKIAKYEVIDY